MIREVEGPAVCSWPKSRAKSRELSHLIPADVPVILESKVEESEINQEMENALNALSTKNHFAFVGD